MSTYDCVVAPQMACRPARLWHFQWHGIRETWSHLSPSERESYRALMGEPPKPSIDADGKVLRKNGAGLQFLSMHRSMVVEATRLNGAPLGRWRPLAALGERSRPAAVPRDFNLPPTVFSGKHNDLWNAFVQQARRFADQEFLRLADIDELGTLIEYGIHAAMHQRFGGFGVNQRMRLTQIGTPGSGISTKWDVLAYDSLLDSYSAHVNRVFWDIHGWVDSVAAEWERAHGKQLPKDHAHMPMHDEHLHADDGDDHADVHAEHDHADARGEHDQTDAHAEHDHGGHGDNQVSHQDYSDTDRSQCGQDERAPLSLKTLEAAAEIVIRAGYGGAFPVRLDPAGRPLDPAAIRLQDPKGSEPTTKSGSKSLADVIGANYSGDDMTRQLEQHRASVVPN